MLYNKISNRMTRQLNQVFAKVRVVDLLPKVRCNNMQNFFYQVTADLIGKKNRNSVVAENNFVKEILKGNGF